MAKKSKPSDDQQHITDLVAALQFVHAIQPVAGPPWQRHAIMWGGMVYGSNGVLMCGHKIDEVLELAPHTKLLIDALERCVDQVSMMDVRDSLIVRSGKLRATVPCHVLRDMPPIIPDPPLAPLDDAPLRAALEAVSPLATDGAVRVIQASVRLAGGTACATNGHVLIEHWHGLDLPDVLLPKASVKAVLSVKKKLTQVGCSANSVTFYYEDDSWIKTQLYVETYPDIERVLKVPSDQWPLAVGFFDALRMMLPFVGTTRRIYTSAQRVHTDPDPEDGSSFECAGIPAGHCFNIDYLLMMEGYAKTADFGKGESDTLKFFGPNVRGVIAAMRRG